MTVFLDWDDPLVVQRIRNITCSRPWVAGGLF
jgi:hypothetical protein